MCEAALYVESPQRVALRNIASAFRSVARIGAKVRLTQFLQIQQPTTTATQKVRQVFYSLLRWWTEIFVTSDRGHLLREEKGLGTRG